MSTLYVVEQGAIIGRSSERITIRKRRRLIDEMPIVNLQQIVIFGNAVLSTQAIELFLKSGIGVAYLSQAGKYRGRLQSTYSDRVALRKSQYDLSDDAAVCLSLSKKFMMGKLKNQAGLLNRQRKKNQTKIAKIRRAIDKLAEVSSLDQLRGLEGSSAAIYFNQYSRSFHPDWNFSKRTRRPPTDGVNVLLSLGYTLLYEYAITALYLTGLDPYCGFYHLPKRGHAALASDLIEEWRPIIIDSLVLQLIKRNHIKVDDFQKSRKKPVTLSKKGLSTFLRSFENQMNRKIIFPRSLERLNYRQSLLTQCRLLVHAIEETNVNSYKPYIVDA